MKTKEQEKERDNVVPIRIMSGGKDGDGNWLIKLKEGSVFLTRPDKPDIVECFQYHIMMKWKRGVWLMSNSFGREFNMYVDTEAFSKVFILIDVLQDGHGSHIHTGSGVVENDEHNSAEHQVLQAKFGTEVPEGSPEGTD